MQLYGIFTILISISALFAYGNHRFLKLPTAIGIMSLSLITSLLVLIGGHLVPQFAAWITGIISAIDFHGLLMNVMLSFLLFAGAIHINAAQLRQQLIPVIVLSTIGTILSTLLVGTILYWLVSLFGISLPFIYCLLFGALISPTDPIAVLGILRHAGIAPSLELKVEGEALFNDGVGVVVFITIMEIAATGQRSVSDVSLLFLREAGGGIVYGLALGYAGMYLLRSIDHYGVEVMITLALVMGGYTLAAAIGVSGPLAMVVAGIIIGNTGQQTSSDITRDYLEKFWHLVDEILNAVLFLLVGFEMLLVHLSRVWTIIGGISILVVLLARWVAVALPVTVLRQFGITFERHAILMLTWAGLRGGISVALALSLPENMHRNEFVSITYAVVVFSIIVQGLTVGKLAKWIKGM
jgi:CPA1 family monovalent cation:H+ antiporter